MDQACLFHFAHGKIHLRRGASAAGAELPGHRLRLAAGRQHVENAGDDISHPQARAAPVGLWAYKDQAIYVLL